MGFGYIRGPRVYSISGVIPPGLVSQYAAPILLNYYALGPSHHLHLGVGVTLLYRTGDLGDTWYNWMNSGYGYLESGGFRALGDFVVGWRYVPPKAGLAFGLDALLLFSADAEIFSAGVNVGFVF